MIIPCSAKHSHLLNTQTDAQCVTKGAKLYNKGFILFSVNSI